MGRPDGPNAHFVCWSLIVELNAVFLTLFKLTNMESLKQVLWFLFLFTWVTLRLLWYPWLVYVYHKALISQGFWSYNYVQVVGSHFVITALNYIWTVELVITRICVKPEDEGAAAQNSQSLVDGQAA